MSDWLRFTDEIGPEKIVHVHDPVSGLKGVVVIDTKGMGGMTGGGIRMMPDITTAEIFGLARAMTYKWNAVDLPIGGCKSGIWADPGLKGEERAAVLRAFGRILKPLMQDGLNFGADIGTEVKDLAFIFEGAEMDSSFTGLMLEEKDGEPLENHATGYGVVVAAKAACEFAGLDINGATMAIEGFGKVGGGVARYADELGAKVVAISTLDGVAYSPDGLDISRLLEDRHTRGDRAITEYADAEHLSREALFTLPVDVLVPGARPYVIDKDLAGQVQARVISSIANIPITEDGEDVLFERGVHVVPDFIANSGGVTIAVVDILGGTAENVFSILDTMIYSLSRDILADAQKEGINPTRLSKMRTREKLVRQRTGRQAVSFEDFLEQLRARFSL